MPPSHSYKPKPSAITTLVALGVVLRHRPDWGAVSLQDAAQTMGISAQRTSRLVTRAIAPFDEAVAHLTRRGRPQGDVVAGKLQAELALATALLQVATAILDRLPLRRRAVGDLIVGAWRRLRGTPGLTQKRFCQALGLKTRTLRSWLSAAPHRPPEPDSVIEETSTEPPRGHSGRPPRRPRFSFDVVLPDTQFAADTTGLSAFGVPLKLVAAQDIGGRDQDLLEAVFIDDHESAEIVSRVLAQAAADKPGAQVIVDQGTPYMAEATRLALDQLELEHAPQREADPQAKGTIEKAFDSAKSIARPLLDLTDRLADAVPQLKDSQLAIAAARLVVTAVLRAYQAGARAATRACQVRGQLDPELLAKMAQQNREHARAVDRSARLLLAHIHNLYDLPRSQKAFVDSLRHYPVEVIQKAERAFRDQVHRDDIRDRQSYFAKLVRVFNEEHQADRRREQARLQMQQRLQADNEQHADHEAEQRQDPAAFLRQAFDALANMWQPDQQSLLLGGVGLARAYLTRALSYLIEDHGYATTLDISAGVFNGFVLEMADKLGPAGLAAVQRVVEAKLVELAPASELASCQAGPALNIFGGDGLKQRPPPSAVLRN